MKSYAPYAGMAYGLAKSAYKDRDMLSYYARLLRGSKSGRSYAKRRRISLPRSTYRRRRRTYRRKVRNQIGRPVGYGTTKRNAALRALTPQNRNNYSLHTRNLTLITRSQDNDARERDIVNFRGVKIDVEFKNVQNTPVCVNWAILMARRSGTGAFDEGTEGNISLSAGNTQVNDFWRGNDQARGIDFFQSSFGSIDVIDRPINSDEITCLKRGKFNLWTTRDAEASWSRNHPYLSNYKHLKKYIPINRQLQYEDSSNTSCQTPFFFCFWIVRLHDTPPMSQIEANVSTAEKYVTYFKEPRN